MFECRGGWPGRGAACRLLTRQQEMYRVPPDIGECVPILSDPPKIDSAQFYVNMTIGCIDWTKSGLHSHPVRTTDSQPLAGGDPLSNTDRLRPNPMSVVNSAHLRIYSTEIAEEAFNYTTCLTFDMHSSTCARNAVEIFRASV